MPLEQQEGGARCLARHGDALYHALYDRGGCIARKIVPLGGPAHTIRPSRGVAA